MSTYLHEHITVGRKHVNRRRFLQRISATAIAAGTLNFREMLPVQAEELRQQGKSMILLWMAGGPSQFETFDPKPNHENGGGTKVISTAIPGVQIASEWKETAKVMHEIALIRSLNNKEGAHQRATYQMHTGYIPSGSVKHPAFGSCVAQQLANAEHELPSVVSIGQTQGAGFLGVDYEPFVVNNPGTMPANVAANKPQARFNRRLGLLDQLEDEFAGRGAQSAVTNHRQLYGKASRLSQSPTTKAFDISEESATLKAAYGDTQFGRGCLLARRLVESGVTFIEVRSNGWDTHTNVFEEVTNKANEVDPASATLITDLKTRGLLDNTIVVWAGEFGRTPKVNARGGRDHYPRAFNCWLAGGGIKGGQVIGETSKDGSIIEDRPVSVADLLQSISKSLNINPSKENISPQGRPMKVVDGGEVIEDLFA